MRKGDSIRIPAIKKKKESNKGLEDIQHLVDPIKHKNVTIFRPERYCADHAGSALAWCIP